MLFRGERLYKALEHPYIGSGTNTNASELANLGAVYELDLRGSGEGQDDVTLATKQLQSVTHYRPDTDATRIRAAVSIKRTNHILYISFNDGTYEEILNMTQLLKTFDVPLTFGSSLNAKGKPQRYFKGTLKNMKVIIYE